MSLRKLPELDAPCGQHFVYRDLVECGETWESAKVDNIPSQSETYEALRLLTELVLDPVSERFGRPTLTYGLSCSMLTKLIKRGIAPKLDQHAAHEESENGNRICTRGGASCDFQVAGVDSLTVAKWIARKTQFDRLYYYGGGSPIHVSASREPKGQCVIVKRKTGSRQVAPTVISIEKFLAL